jgi:hypothetical protein
MISIPHAYNPDEFFSTTLPAWYDTTNEDDFPGYIGGNHAGINTRGPLKSDWTKACPLEWTKEERDENCISLQEIIWGTKTLKRLEAIKEIIDPNYMFDCNGTTLISTSWIVLFNNALTDIPDTPRMCWK